jgi:hypothetical protein
VLRNGLVSSPPGKILTSYARSMSGTSCASPAPPLSREPWKREPCVSLHVTGRFVLPPLSSLGRDLLNVSQFWNASQNNLEPHFYRRSSKSF